MVKGFRQHIWLKIRQSLVLSSMIALAAPVYSPYAAPKPADPKVFVYGTVFFEGKPVSGADIYLLISNQRVSTMMPSTSEKIARSGKDGSFSFSRPRSRLGVVSYSNSLAAFAQGYAIGFATLKTETDSARVSISLSKSNPISGKVIDRSGKPVSRARVWIKNIRILNFQDPTLMTSGGSISLNNRTPGTSTDTDSQGKFSLASMPERGILGVMVDSPGSAQYYRWSVAAGSDTLTFILSPEGRIGGKLTFKDSGKPAPGAQIYCMFITPSSSSVGNTTGTGSAVTDKNGKFLISNLLPASSYTLYVSPEGVYKDWVAKPRDKVSVEAGKTTGDADLVLSKGGIITGKITDKDTGAPIARVPLYIQQNRVGTPATDENGVYRIQTVPGEMTVTAYPPQGYINDFQYPAKKVTVEEGGTITGIDFHFSKGIELKGTTRTQDGKPVAGVRISASTSASSFGGPSTTSDTMGQFTISGFKPGEKVTLKAAQPEMHLQSRVDLEAKPGTQIDIMLKNYKTASIEGTVFKPDGSPAPGVDVNLLRWDKERAMGMSSVAAVSGKDGKFRITDLEVGNDYGLSAQDNQANTGTFTLTETPKPFELKLPLANRWLEGKVTDSGGVPLSGVRVMVNGASGTKMTSTDDKGHYRLDGLISIAEEISLSTNTLGYFNYKYVLTNHTRDFALVTGDRYLAGSVVDSEGKPVSGASVSIQGSGSGRSLIPTSTDAEGKFRLEKLSNKVERISVSTRDQRYKTFPDIETNRDGVILNLDPAPQTDSKVKTLTSVSGPPPIGAPYPVKVSSGKAPITIDGDLSDWKGLGAKTEQIRYGDPVNMANIRQTKPREPDNLSCDFQCSADRDYVYFAVKVTDDKLRFGYTNFEFPSYDDCVEFQLFGDLKTAYAGQIFISAEKDGAVKLGGRDPVSNEKYPYFWQTAGVKAALKQRAGGYDVEMAVPWSVLRWTGWGKEHLTAMNLFVYDRDYDKENVSGGYGMVEWASSPNENYGILKFDSIPDPEGQYKSEKYDELNAILKCIKNSEWDKAESALSGAGNSTLMKSMLANVQMKAGKREQYIKTLVEIAKTDPTPSVSAWAVSAALSNLRGYEYQGKSNEAITLYEELSKLPVSDTVKPNLFLGMGRCYLITGQFERSKEIISALINSPAYASADPQASSDAKALLEASTQALAEKK